MLNLNQPQGSVGTSPALDGTGLTNPTNWRSLLGVDSLTDSRRRAFAGGQPGVEFDGATNNTRITSVLTAQPFSGTGDFSLWVRFRVPAVNVASSSIVVALADSAASFASANSFYFELNRSDGQLAVGKRTAGNVYQTAFAVSGFQTAYAGQVIDLVLCRVAGAWKCYCNGNDITPGTTNFANETVSFTYLHLGNGGGAPCWNDRIYRVAVFNRGLSAADVADLIVNGIADEDQWGTQTAPWVSNFSAGVDGVTTLAGTGAGNIDAIGSPSTNDTYRYTVDGTTAVHYSQKALVLTVGKRFRLSGQVFIPAAQTVITQMQVQDTGSLIIGPNYAKASTWTALTPTEFVARGTALVFYWMNGSNFTFAGNSADVGYLNGILVERIGALVDLNLGEGAGLCFTDRSTNALHAIGTGGISHVVAGRQGCVRVRTTGTGNIQLGGAGIIPTNGRIRFITADAVSGTPTITVGSASGGAQHIPSIALAAGFNELSPVARFNTTGNLWVNVSATATVDWTVIYDLVD